MYIAYEKSNLSKILYISGKDLGQKFEIDRLKTLMAKMTKGRLVSSEISIYFMNDDSEEAQKVEYLMRRKVKDFNFISLNGDGNGNVESVDFGDYDAKPVCTITLSKNEIEGADETDTTTIVFSLNRKFTGKVYMEIRGAVNQFAKVLKFDNSDKLSFNFHSKYLGNYLFPSVPIEEFQDIEPKILKVVF